MLDVKILFHFIRRDEFVLFSEKIVMDVRASSRLKLFSSSIRLDFFYSILDRRI